MIVQHKSVTSFVTSSLVVSRGFATSPYVGEEEMAGKLSSKEKEIIANLSDIFEVERTRKRPSHFINLVKRVVEACGVAKRTAKRCRCLFREDVHRTTQKQVHPRKYILDFRRLWSTISRKQPFGMSPNPLFANVALSERTYDDGSMPCKNS